MMVRFMEQSQTTRVALVTGAAQGIGRALVQDLLAHGWQVAAADLPVQQAGLGRTLATAPEGAALAVALDVTDEASVAAAVGETVARFSRLDLLVNNAGLAKARTGPVAELTREVWDLYLAVNLTGPFLCAKHAAPALRAAGGVIINLSSVRARRMDPHNEAYSASKAGVIGLTRALAQSLAPAVRVYALCPGWIDTSRFTKEGRAQEFKSESHAFHPVGRIGQPEDLAGWVRFLASPAAAFCTGEAFTVDGGVETKLVYR